MTSHRAVLVLASIALAAGALGACSRSASSPTEPSLAAFDDASKSLSSASDESRRGGGGSSGSGSGSGQDDGSADDRRGRGHGNDDGTTDNRGRGRGSRGRGNRPDEPRPPRVGQEFEATVQSVTGQTLTLAGGLRVTVDAQTRFDPRGDLLSLAAIAGSVAANERPRVEGRGERQADGSIRAATIKAEVDN
jgi:hypothetical protein